MVAFLTGLSKERSPLNPFISIHSNSFKAPGVAQLSGQGGPWTDSLLFFIQTNGIHQLTSNCIQSEHQQSETSGLMTPPLLSTVVPQPSCKEDFLFYESVIASLKIYPDVLGDW